LSALAGAGYIGKEYVKLDPTENMTEHNFTRNEIMTVIQAVAAENKAGNFSIQIKDEDVVIGIWEVGDDDPSVTLKGPNAVRVIARRDSSINGQIATFFAKIFGIDSVDISSKKAIAALGGLTSVGEGDLNCPFAVSEHVFPDKCESTISFSPTDSCASWHNFLDPINADNMEEKLIGLIEGNIYGDLSGNLSDGSKWLEDNFDINKDPDSLETPETNAGTEFYFQGGVISSLFNGGYLDTDYDTGSNPGNLGTVIDNEKKPAPILALFDYFRYRDNHLPDPEGIVSDPNLIWDALIPVYADTYPCSNPNSKLQIVGFAQIYVKQVNPPPSSNISVYLECEKRVIEGSGGGPVYGNLMGSIPNLVK